MSLNSTGAHITFRQSEQAWVGLFKLMASECEIHIRTSDAALAKNLITQAYTEGKRIEQHFSRYINNNPLYLINHSPNTALTLDSEYCELMHYAFTLYDISEGMFDISCGGLRQLWTFNNTEQQPPTQQQINTALAHVGLSKIQWAAPTVTLPQHMELDFGGIGKEYAVDKAAQIIQRQFGGDYLVNFGGDCYCRGTANTPWTVAIESNSHNSSTSHSCPTNALTLIEGGVATSGTTKRFFTVNGKRFGHILNPKTGRPIEHAPLAVTAVNENCLAAGALSTLAMLEGANAERFLEEQEILHWVLR